jgi:ribonuclease HII
LAVIPDPLGALFAELGRLRLLDRVEKELRRRGYRLVAGVDEVGRGCLAGPVVAAAVILPENCVLPGLDDSKKLDAACRERLDALVRRCAIAVGVGTVSAPEIDHRDILRASLRAMRIAIEALRPEPDAVLLDAVSIPGLRRPQLPVVHGDALCSAIAAASIVAKVYRDRLLDDLARSYPAYGFERHKGYGTPEHWEALAAAGPCPEHRLTFHGVVPGRSGAPAGLPSFLALGDEPEDMESEIPLE